VEIKMTDSTTKIPSPPYVSFKTFTTLLDQLKEAKLVPDQIDRSFLKNFSGAAQSELQLALKFFGFTDENYRVKPALEDFAFASNSDRKSKLAELLVLRYDFVLKNPSINIEKATTNQVADAFRTKQLSGSTLSRAVSFFIAAAKETGIKIPEHLKAPAISKESTPKPRKKGASDSKTADEKIDEESDLSKPRPHNFEIPIPGKSSVKISVPADFDSQDWELLTVMFQAYVKRWKSFPESKS
jgi:hypothetical protein